MHCETLTVRSDDREMRYSQPCSRHPAGAGCQWCLPKNSRLARFFRGSCERQCRVQWFVAERSRVIGRKSMTTRRRRIGPPVLRSLRVRSPRRTRGRLQSRVRAQHTLSILLRRPTGTEDCFGQILSSRCYFRRQVRSCSTCRFSNYYRRSHYCTTARNQ